MALDALVVDGNPHAAQPTACCPAQALPSEMLLQLPIPLKMQADTFVRQRQLKHLDKPVDVYTFRQPARLSHKQLPFDLALASAVDPTGIVEVPAPPEQAKDSWFEEYAWTHFVVCTAAATDGGASAVHLGWRFTRKPGASSASAPVDSFVALIVRAEKQQPAKAAAIVTRNGEAIAAAVLRRDGVAHEVTTDVLDEAAEDDVPVPETLSVGVEAPGWMVAMLAAVTARSTRGS